MDLEVPRSSRGGGTIQCLRLLNEYSDQNHGNDYGSQTDAKHISHIVARYTLSCLDGRQFFVWTHGRIVVEMGHIFTIHCG